MNDITRASTEFTLDAALELCRKHAGWYPDAPSVSRTLVREIERLQRELEAAYVRIASLGGQVEGYKQAIADQARRVATDCGCAAEGAPAGSHHRHCRFASIGLACERCDDSGWIESTGDRGEQVVEPCEHGQDEMPSKLPPMPTLWDYLRAAASETIRAVDANHDEKAPPLKYIVPWAQINSLRDALSKLEASQPLAERDAFIAWVLEEYATGVTAVAVRRMAERSWDTGESVLVSEREKRAWLAGRASQVPDAPEPPPRHWVRYADSDPYERPYYLGTYSSPKTKHAKSYLMIAQEDFDRLLRQRTARPPVTQPCVLNAALVEIRNITRSDPADFETAYGDMQTIYHLANNALQGDAQPPVSDPYRSMFQAAVSNLAEISRALDIPDDVASAANGNEEILDAIAALKEASQPPAPGWRPIESALTDGTPILVANEERDGAWIARYEPVYQSGYRPENPWFSLMLNMRWHVHNWASTVPTHWMPLPSPPTKSVESP